MRHRYLLAGLTAAALMAAGCKHCRTCNPSASAPSGARLDPPTRPSGIPPQDIPTAPSSSVPSLPPPELPDSRSSFRLGEPVPPKPAEPTPPASEILLPDPLPGSSSQKPTAPRKSWLGEPIRPEGSPAPDTDTPERTAEKPADPTAPNRQPAGFVRVPGRDGLAAGRVPTGGELDWLAANGFKTVLLLHDPKADVTDFRTQVERRGLRAVAVPVGDLPAAYESFARAAADRGARPVYVADADADRAAAMWFALFRKQELAGDEVARLRVSAVGGRPERAAIWPAVQDLLK